MQDTTEQAREVIKATLDSFHDGLRGKKTVAILTALADAGLVIEQGWQPIETAPKDGRQILGFGSWAGEINGIDRTPCMLVIQWRGGQTDYPGFDWTVVGTDAYAAWMKPLFWRDVPNLPTFPASPEAAETHQTADPETTGSQETSHDRT